VQTGGTAVFVKTAGAHQCTGADCRNVCCTGIREDRRNVHVHLRMDNTSALTYVSKIGGSFSTRLTAVAYQIWDWCLQRQITLSPSHLPGLDNQVADQEYRSQQNGSSKEIFVGICTQLGPCKADLFATRLNLQLYHHVNWRPDPGAMETNAFYLILKGLEGYAFPPSH